MTGLTQVEAIFHTALAKSSAEERTAYLDEECRGDPELRLQVERLLNAQPELGSFLEQPAAAEVASLPGTVELTPMAESPGTLIGPYKLMEQIGEGGMGLVFVAEQQQPVRRKVALKVIKPGMDTRQVIARFEAERQALALMDHPNIAKVHDGGETASGRPYFVMELVKGVPITEYCDQNQVPVRERLEIFLSVCQAVQHAHQKGIIHRDIKPSNVMVASHDGVPVAKIIDFGVAKAVGQHLTDKTVYTQFAQLVGTPLYMSPEQAGLSALDVDTRSDVYSLGVLLYELLTGTTPFDKERFKETSNDEILRIIREEEPPKPSTRISTLGQAATTISTQRKSEPKQLSRLFRGELDWIVMKALEKDRNRRYETASALATDVQRYLHDEPVQACPPSVGYRVGKFVRRNRHAALAASLVLAALLSGVAVSTWQWFVAEGRRVRAQQAEKKAQAINDFLIKEMLTAGTPERARGRPVTAEEVLDRAAAKIEGAFPGQPEVEAELQMAIASAYRSLSLYGKAEPHFERAVRIREAFLGGEHRDTLVALKQLGALWADWNRYAEAEKLCRQTLDTARRVLANDDPLTLELEHLIAYVVMELDRPDESEEIFRRCLQKRIRILGEDDPDTLETMIQFALLLGERRGRWQEAEPLARRCVEIRERALGKDHPDTLNARTTFADAILRPEGKWQKAEALQRETLAIASRALGPNHDVTLNVKHNLAIVLANLDQMKDAEDLFRECIKVRSSLSSSQDPEVLKSRRFLADVLLARGKVDEAEQEFRDTLALSRQVRGPDDIVTLFALVGTGLVHQAKGRWGEAEDVLREALKRCQGAHKPEDPITLVTTSKLAVMLEWAGNHSEAGPLLRSAVEARRRILPAEHPDLAIALYFWAEHLLAEGNLRQAEPALEEALRIERAALPPKHRALGLTVVALGWLYSRSGRASQGELLVREGLVICRGAYPPQHWATSDAQSRLGACLAAQGRFAESEALFLEAQQALQGIPGTPAPRLRQAVERIVSLYEATSQGDKAAAWQAKLLSEHGSERSRHK